MENKSGFGIACDAKKECHESANFPILCETCLGDNPYVRMTRQHSGKECRICCRPYTVFRWKPGPTARFKQTVICQYCAKLKNVCQTCLFDLEYGLPVQVRDKFLAEAGGAESLNAYNNNKIDFSNLSHVNRNYLAAQCEKNGNNALLGCLNNDEYNNNNHLPPNPVLSRLSRVSPYYKRNAPRVCSFWIKGECTRGSSCPYLHAEEKHDPSLSHQNIKDRYAGVEDPVAMKILQQEENYAVSSSVRPSDSSICTLFLKNIDTYRITENDIRDEFYSYGEIKQIRINRANNTAFVAFMTRKAAENAIDALHSSLVIKGCHIRLDWAMPYYKLEDCSKKKEEEDTKNLPIHFFPMGDGVGFNAGVYASMNPVEAEHRR